MSAIICGRMKLEVEVESKTLLDLLEKYASPTKNSFK